MSRPRSRSNGKLVDTWYFDYRGLVINEAAEHESLRQLVTTAKVAVRLILMKTFAGETPPLATKEVWFEVEADGIPAPPADRADAPTDDGITDVAPHDPTRIHLRGSDIEALRTAVWARLDARYAIRWERYYLVRVDRASIYAGIGSGLAFSYTWVEKGVAWDNTVLLRERAHQREERISPWPGEFRDRNGYVQACIPATEANTAALEEFSRRVDALRREIAKLLKPERIQETLATMGSCTLLPPPTAETSAEPA